MEQQPQSAGALKVEEYVARIKSGESKDSIIENLPPSFVSAINKKLAEPEEKAKVSVDLDPSAVEVAEKLHHPPINYIEIVIDDDYMRKNLMPGGGLMMQGGQANWDNEVDIMKYVISDNLSSEFRQIAAEKIAKREAGEETTYQHEAQHISNRENGLAPHVAAESLREFLAFRVLDEMSAFSRGELHNQEMTAENIIKALKLAEASILQSYYGVPFEGDASWYMSQHGNETNALSREIDTDKYHQVMRQYFKINSIDIFTTLQDADQMPEFTAIVNSLILKLDNLLAAKNPNF